MRLLLAALLLHACARPHPAPDDAGLPPQSELAAEVAAAGQSAWDDADLKTAPETTCLLDELRIVREPCPRANACLGWRAVLVPVPGKRRPQRMFVPIAYVPPALTTEQLVAHAAVHEYMHTLVGCFGYGRFGDTWDAAHRNPRVWEGPGRTNVWSAEMMAQRMLDGTPEPGSLPEGDEGLDSP